jgi:flagellar motor switch/type III secretory pathway protein FliN
MSMAAGASLARVLEKAPVQVAGGTAPHPEAGGGEANGETREDARWRRVLDLPCELTVDLPLPGFRIADLMQLRAGSVIGAHWRLDRDVPLHLNGTPLGWIEFEVMGNSLAVRLTELA